MLEVCPDLDIVEVPVADGGDGTLDAVIDAGFERVPITATGPLGAPVETSYARRGTTAFVELASIAGLTMLTPDSNSALRSSTRGVGEVIAAAIDSGCLLINLGLGGSASTDGGAGMLMALGARVLDRAGNPLPDGGAALLELGSVDLVPVQARLKGSRIVVASDVDSPLLGATGAVAVFGPQKGVDGTGAVLLESALGRWAALVAQNVGRDHRAEPGAGAAGGVGFAALAALRAELLPGVDVILDLLDFSKTVVDATLVVTGEGRIDEQTSRGKAPVGVARAARAAGVPVIAVSGQSTLGTTELREMGFSAAYTLTDQDPFIADHTERSPQGLRVIGRQIAARYFSPCEPVGERTESILEPGALLLPDDQS
jgi:glycerate kinase